MCKINAFVNLIWFNRCILLWGSYWIFKKNAVLYVCRLLPLVNICIWRTIMLYQEPHFTITSTLSLLEEKFKLLPKSFVKKCLFCGLLKMSKLLQNYRELMHRTNKQKESNTCILEERKRKIFWVVLIFR